MPSPPRSGSGSPVQPHRMMTRVDHGETRRSRIARFVHANRHSAAGHHGLFEPPAGARRGAHGEAFVRLSRVSKTYGSGLAAVQALREIDLEISFGELVAVIGPRGSGKTTLIELIGATQRPTSGEILIGGRRVDLLDDRARLEFRTANVALAPQAPTLAPTLSAYETVLQAARTSRAQRPDQWTHALLEAFDLQDEVDVLTASLSAESQQRLSVARALAKEAPLILLDEPLSATDIEDRQRLIATVRRFARRGSTVVVTAPTTESTPSADRVISL